MKFKLFFVAALITITFNNCKKEDLIGSGSMSAKIDGTAWTAVTRVTVEKNGNFIITGTNSNGEVLELTVFGNTEGTYKLDAASMEAKCGAVYKPALTNTDSTFVSKSGTISLTTVDTENLIISGTFNFSVSNLSLSKTITDGKFSNLKYKQEN